MSGTRERLELLDATIDLIASEGYASVNPNRVIRHSRLDEAVFAQEFANHADWIVAAFDRLCERRLRRFEKIGLSLARHGSDVDRSLDALLTTVMAGIEPDPLFVASYDIFFMSRADSSLLRRLLEVRNAWEPKLSAVTATFFPVDTPALARRVVLVHLEALGGMAIASGIGVVEAKRNDLVIMRSLLERTVVV
jgi:AcrR family transcriptional regulator